MTAYLALLIALSAVGWLALGVFAAYVLVIAYCLAGALWDVWRESRQGRAIG